MPIRSVPTEAAWALVPARSATSTPARQARVTYVNCIEQLPRRRTGQGTRARPRPPCSLWPIRANRYAHRPDSRGRGFDQIAGLDLPHARRGAGEDQIAGVERVELLRIVDERGDVAEHVRRRGLLTDRAVEREHEIDRVRIAQFVGRDDPRAGDRI